MPSDRKKPPIGNPDLDLGTTERSDGPAVPDWRDDALVKYEAFAREREPALLMKLIELSQDSTRDRMQKIRQAVAGNDAKQIDFFAHDLKGSSGGFLASELSARAADLQEAIGDPRRVAEILPRLEVAADDALKWWSDLARRVTRRTICYPCRHDAKLPHCHAIEGSSAAFRRRNPKAVEGHVVRIIADSPAIERRLLDHCDLLIAAGGWIDPDLTIRCADGAMSLSHAGGDDTARVLCVRTEVLVPIDVAVPRLDGDDIVFDWAASALTRDQARLFDVQCEIFNLTGNTNGAKF